MSAKTYLYTLRLGRPEAATSPTGEEEAIFEDHFAHLQRCRDHGSVLLAGPCTDGAFGIVILRAQTDDAARELMLADPAVAQGLMTAELVK